MAFMKKFKKVYYGYIKVDAMNTNDANREIIDGDYKEVIERCEFRHEDWEVI